jgi:hypothetical protein
MLREEAVSTRLLSVLRRLMNIPLLSNHRLVGGTALALQIGHRISVDIDLFCNSNSDYLEIEKAILNKFPNEIKISHYINSTFGKGICFSIEGIKTDIIDWKTPFAFPPLNIDNICMASIQDILRMKLDIITSPPETARYDKKDYFDLVFLMQEFGVSQMIDIFKQSHPMAEFPERIVLEALQYSELADKKPNPNMLIGISWNEVKARINLAIHEYLNSKIY